MSKAACFGCGCHAWSLALLCWYGTGHAPQFSALKVSSGFAFVASFNWYICGASLFFETFAPVLVWAMFLAILSLKRRSPHEMGFAGLAFVLSALAVAGLSAAAAAAAAALRCVDAMDCVAHLAFFSVCSLVFTGLQRRHLMVWRIFAPKFVFSVSLAGAAIAAWLTCVARVACARSSSEARASDDRRRD